MKFFIATILLFYFLSFNANADYEVKGQIKGFVCEGIFIEACKYKKIDTVDNSEGQLHTLKKTYKKVDEYKKVGNKDICIINVNGGYFGFINSFRNMLKKGDNFFTLNKNGEYQKVSIEYLMFECSKK